MNLLIKYIMNKLKKMNLLIKYVMNKYKKNEFIN